MKVWGGLGFRALGVDDRVFFPGRAANEQAGLDTPSGPFVTSLPLLRWGGEGACAFVSGNKKRPATWCGNDVSWERGGFGLRVWGCRSSGFRA